MNYYLLTLQKKHCSWIWCYKTFEDICNEKYRLENTNWYFTYIYYIYETEATLDGSFNQRDPIWKELREKLIISN